MKKKTTKFYVDGVLVKSFYNKVVITPLTISKSGKLCICLETNFCVAYKYSGSFGLKKKKTKLPSFMLLAS